MLRDARMSAMRKLRCSGELDREWLLLAAWREAEIMSSDHRRRFQIRPYPQAVSGGTNAVIGTSLPSTRTMIFSGSMVRRSL